MIHQTTHLLPYNDMIRLSLNIIANHFYVSSVNIQTSSSLICKLNFSTKGIRVVIFVLVLVCQFAITNLYQVLYFYSFHISLFIYECSWFLEHLWSGVRFCGEFYSVRMGKWSCWLYLYIIVVYF